jgi:hypothetical protein
MFNRRAIDWTARSRLRLSARADTRPPTLTSLASLHVAACLRLLLLVRVLLYVCAYVSYLATNSRFPYMSVRLLRGARHARRFHVVRARFTSLGASPLSPPVGGGKWAFVVRAMSAYATPASEVACIYVQRVYVRPSGRECA